MEGQCNCIFGSELSKNKPGFLMLVLSQDQQQYSAVHTGGVRRGVSVGGGTFLSHFS